MLGNLFLFSSMSALVFLCLWEWRRYRIAREESGDWPYPRRRLIRRWFTAFLGLIILAGMAFKPPTLTISQDLQWYGACMVFALIVLYLAIIDLREAGSEALEAQRTFQNHAERQLRGLIEESGNSRTGRRRRGS